MAEPETTTPRSARSPHVLAERRAKLERLREAGDRAVPARVRGREPRSPRCARRTRGSPPARRPRTRYRVAGRIAARRGQGKAAFLDLVDAHRADPAPRARATCSARSRSTRLLGLDLGDIVGVDGTAFATARGELSLRSTAGRCSPRACARRPTSTTASRTSRLRYRHRELDLIANPEVARAVSQARRGRSRRSASGSTSEGFVEVETPVLQPLYGGALARPFTTHHNALDRDLYLRIATELYLKRCIVGGLERVYELGKDFRNEGSRSSTTPSSRCSSGTRPTPTTRTRPSGSSSSSPTSPSASSGRPRSSATGSRSTSRRPGGGSPCATRSASGPGSTSLEHPTREALAAAMGSEREPRRGLGQARRRPALEGGRAELIQPTFVLDYPVELSPVRQAPPLRRGPGRALRGLRRRVRDRQRVHRAQRPRRAAPPLRAAGRGAAPRRRRGPAVRRGLPRGARARDAADRRGRPRHRPPGDAAHRRAPACARSCCSRRCGDRRRGDRGDRSRGHRARRRTAGLRPRALATAPPPRARSSTTQRVDPDGDGDAHFVLLSEQAITAPWISVIDVARDLRPHPLPKPGALVAAAGPVYPGSYGQRQIQATAVAVAGR